MTDVQVSNARRVGFTALAVVMLLFATKTAYGGGFDLWDIVANHCLAFDNYSVDDVKRGTKWWPNSSLVVLPTLFLSVSVHNSPREVVRDIWILVAGLLFLGCVWCGFWIGAHNALPTSTLDEWRELVLAYSKIRHEMNAARVQEGLRVSWLWLLVPIILTTAFVIFGAWRSAVRDAEGEPVGEGK